MVSCLSVCKKEINICKCLAYKCSNGDHFHTLTGDGRHHEHGPSNTTFRHMHVHTHTYAHTHTLNWLAKTLKCATLLLRAAFCLLGPSHSQSRDLLPSTSVEKFLEGSSWDLLPSISVEKFLEGFHSSAPSHSQCPPSSLPGKYNLILILLLLLLAIRNSVHSGLNMAHDEGYLSEISTKV